MVESAFGGRNARSLLRCTASVLNAIAGLARWRALQHFEQAGHSRAAKIVNQRILPARATHLLTHSWRMYNPNRPLGYSGSSFLKTRLSPQLFVVR